MVLMQKVEDVRHLVIPADTGQQAHLHTPQWIDQMKNERRRSVCGSVGGAYQKAEVLSWGQVGVAEVAGGLQHSDDPLDVTGETETVVSHDQQLHDCRRGRRGG